jgi:predicted transcriptional regulator
MSRAHEIRDLMEAGLSQRAIGRSLGVSGPAINQWIRKTPELRLLRSQRTRGELKRLRAYKLELQQVERELKRLARLVRASVHAITEELQSAEIDAILGLRD